MKKILFVLMSFFAFLVINSTVHAQDVSFGNDVYSNGTNTMVAHVLCSESATVVFEIRTALLSTSNVGSAFYNINGVSYYTYPNNGATVVYYMTVNLPAGTSRVKIDAYNTSAIILLKSVNGRPDSTRPISFRPVN